MVIRGIYGFGFCILNATRSQYFRNEIGPLSDYLSVHCSVDTAGSTILRVPPIMDKHFLNFIYCFLPSGESGFAGLIVLSLLSVHRQQEQ